MPKKELRIQTIEDIKKTKVKITFSEDFLKGLLAMLIQRHKLCTLKNLNNIKKLMDIIDPKAYKKDMDTWSRIEVIQLTATAVADDQINGQLLKGYVKEKYHSPELVDYYFEEAENMILGDNDIKFILNTMADRLAYSCVMALKESFYNILEEFDDKTISFKDKMDMLYSISNATMIIKRETETSVSNNKMFSLRCDRFDNIMDEVLETINFKNKVYRTGIRRLNTLLGGGYLSKRLYTFVAFPGGGKSTMLLKAAVDIKRYNHVELNDPMKTPAILLITMENDIDETVERLFNMTSSANDIRAYGKEDVKTMLKETGGMTITDESNMDILIRYYKVNSISTADLYTIIDDLSNDGYEIKVLILDYLKRIRCVDKVMDEKTKLKNVTNELKALATELNIPVITAHQLNRTSATTVDNALQSNKIDVTKLIGRDAIGDAWEINENCDWLCVLNQERNIDDDIFMSFKLLKRRYKSLEPNVMLHGINYFSHPFEKGNTIKLIDDINNKKSLSLSSLGGNMVDEAIGTRGRVEFSDNVKKAFSSVSFNMNDEGLKD